MVKLETLKESAPINPGRFKLAKRLGVSHTAIANKLREYGLSQRKAADEAEE